MGDFKVGVSVGVYCTKCALNTGVNTNFEITHCLGLRHIISNFEIEMSPSEMILF
jgi:hypothetical protein